MRIIEEMSPITFLKKYRRGLISNVKLSPEMKGGVSVYCHCN